MSGFSEPVAEPPHLLVGRDVQEELHQSDPVGDQHALELVDLIVGAAPFGGGGEALDPLDQHPAVPRPVEGDDLAVPRQALPETLQIMERFLPLFRGGDGVDLEASRVERPAEPPDHAALASRVPAFKHDDRALRRAEIGLLDALQRLLQLGETAFVISEVHRREAVDRGQVWTPPDDDEIGNLHRSGPLSDSIRPRDCEPFRRQRQAGCGNASPPARLPLPELEPLDLAGRGLGQFGDELDGARVFVGGEAVLDETLQLGLVG